MMIEEENETQEKIINFGKIQFIKYEPELLLEFICPETNREEDYVETEYCEAMCLNQGCKHLKTCLAYLKQKNFEKKYPQANRTLTTRKRFTGYKELYTNLKMVKEGIIIPPNTTKESE